MFRRSEPRQPKRKSLQAKLSLLVLASVSLAVTLVAVVSTLRDGRREAVRQTEHLQATAAVIASLAGEATAAKDSAHAFQAIRSITAMPQVTYGRISTTDGYLLAEVGGGARLTRDVTVKTGDSASILATLTSRTVEVSAPVKVAGRKVGEVTLLGQLEGLWARLASTLAVGLGLALVAAGVGLALASRMQRSISGPILALTDAVGQVRETGSFDRAVDVQADDEVGALVDGFNAMLGEIRERDAALAEHMAGLERTVAERTADLVEAKDAADAANSAKSDFLATMSHEIRTPMNGIMVMAEMLAAGEVAPRQRRFAEVIAKSGSSLLAIINDILDFSKIEAGKMDLELAPLDPAEIADDVASLFWERARSKGLDLAAYVDPSVPAIIEGDAVRLRQIVGNLVNNAIKFTEAGGVLIEMTSPAPGTLRVRVHDTGIGIAEEKLGSLFSAFTQADQSTTRKFGGTGLGLAICKRLVEAMGGEVSVRSALGKGSTFGFDAPMRVLEPAKPWLCLQGTVDLRLAGPATAKAARGYFAKAGLELAAGGDLVLADADQVPLVKGAPTICLGEYGDAAPAALQRDGLADAVLIQPLRRRDLVQVLEAWAAGEPMGEAIAAGHEEEKAALPMFAGARVLVADDSAVNREVALEALSRLGVQAAIAQDGLQAVAAVRDGDFQLVLMDGSMPEMDGYEATVEIRRMEAERGAARLPIVALTAHVVGASADAWREAGMDGVLHKPFTLASLAQTLGRFLIASEAGVTPATEARPETPAPAVPASDLLDEAVTGELARMAAAGRGDFVERVQKLYRENAPVAAHACADALNHGDAAEATRAAHALKSMSLNIGARAVAELSAHIEAEGREGRTEAGLGAKLQAALSATLAVLSGEPAPAPPAAVDGELALMAELSHAIARGEFSLVYQPKVGRDGAGIVGAECLVRWTHGKLGPVSPAVFIPLAEKHGRIREITDWVLCQLMREADQLPGVVIGFNASATEFADPAFASAVAARIKAQGFDPRRLEIEVTETAVLADGDQVRRTMDRLHGLGMTVALDDFGVGYSSLSHLRLYPFDTLKIDKSFIDNCVGDVESATLVHAVISIGRALGMKVIAEGIETEAQAKFLKTAGVHAMQGWLFGKPVPVADLAARLAAERAAA